MLYQFLRNWLVALTQLWPRPAFLYLPHYFADWIRYRRSSGKNRPRVLDSYPCLTDRVVHTPFDPHYFYQAGWLARRLPEAAPNLHVDVGSSVMMINMLSAFAETVFVDYRPLPARLENLHPVAGDIARLPFADASVASISCLHVIEHIGLGRYGDALDTEGSLKAAVELARVISSGGRLYLSAPVGRERVCFNAHRVFDPDRLAGMFPRMSLVEFSFVDDRGRLHEHQSPESAQSSDYACGLYIFCKQ